jgi:hypothetical protein
LKEQPNKKVNKNQANEFQKEEEEDDDEEESLEKKDQEKKKKRRKNHNTKFKRTSHSNK